MGYERRRSLRGTKAIQAVLVLLMIWVGYQFLQYIQPGEGLRLGTFVAGVDVSGRLEAEAIEMVRTAYAAPVTLHYGNTTITLNPETVRFQVDAEAMMSTARAASQSNFLGGFLAYLLHRPEAQISVPLQASYDETALRQVLQRLAQRYDQPMRPPHGVLNTLSFVPGSPGQRLDVEASLPRVVQALYSPIAREAELVIQQVEPPPPGPEMLRDLLSQRMAEFPGIASIFIVHPGQRIEIADDADIAFAAMSIIKIAIMEETYRLLDGPPDPETRKLLTETMTLSGNYTANLLLERLGDGSAQRGAEKLTESMRYLGLRNTFMAAPYDYKGPARTITTPANSRKDKNTLPDPYMQTTARDMGLLLEMILLGAEGKGTLLAAYPDQITPTECQEMLDLLAQNELQKLIVDGVPKGTPVAHKHGWIADSHADVGIVYAPTGPYVLSIFLYRPGWLEWELSSTLMSDISKATYNYFTSNLR